MFRHGENPIQRRKICFNVGFCARRPRAVLGPIAHKHLAYAPGFTPWPAFPFIRGCGACDITERLHRLRLRAEPMKALHYGNRLTAITVFEFEQPSQYWPS